MRCPRSWNAARAAVPPRLRSPPARLIYAAPHFLLVSMPLSPLPPFFFPLCCLCIALLLFSFFFLLIAHRPPRYPSKLQYLGLPACVHSKWAFILPEEGTVVPITLLGCGPSGVREVFLFFFYFIVAECKLCIPNVDAPGPWLRQNWRGGRGRPSPPSRRRCRAQRRPSVPSCAAPACRLLAAVAGLARRLRGHEGLYLKKKGKEKKKEKKFHFCFVCPHFICVT